MIVRTLTACGAMLLATGAVAQTATHAGSHNPAVKNSAAARVAAPAAGANSFSQDQARGRLAKAGYSAVSTLTKDSNGVWRGTAMRAGKKVNVGLDYKGNVTTR
jgi:putative membrane protein